MNIRIEIGPWPEAPYPNWKFITIEDVPEDIGDQAIHYRIGAQGLSDQAVELAFALDILEEADAKIDSHGEFECQLLDAVKSVISILKTGSNKAVKSLVLASCTYGEFDSETNDHPVVDTWDLNIHIIGEQE